jgi:hypothetical protein
VAEGAALLAGGDDAAVDVVELARRARERARERRAGVDLAAQVGDELALARVLGLVGERRQRALERQARADQAGELARPDREAGRVEDPAREAEAGGAVPPETTCVTASGTSALARSCERAARVLSASTRPLCALPVASSASNR